MPAAPFSTLSILYHETRRLSSTNLKNPRPNGQGMSAKSTRSVASPAYQRCRRRACVACTPGPSCLADTAVGYPGPFLAAPPPHETPMGVDRTSPESPGAFPDTRPRNDQSCDPPFLPLRPAGTPTETGRRAPPPSACLWRPEQTIRYPARTPHRLVRFESCTYRPALQEWPPMCCSR